MFPSKENRRIDSAPSPKLRGFLLIINLDLCIVFYEFNYVRIKLIINRN